MFGWLVRSRRVDGLETEIASLRARLADADAAATLETERARAATAIGALGDRLAGLHALAVEQAERATATAIGLSALADRVAAIEARTAASESDAEAAEAAVQTAQAEEIAILRAQLLTLDRQFRLQTTQADDTARALLERIEQVRRGEPL